MGPDAPNMIERNLCIFAIKRYGFFKKTPSFVICLGLCGVNTTEFLYIKVHIKNYLALRNLLFMPSLLSSNKSAWFGFAFNVKSPAGRYEKWS